MSSGDSGVVALQCLLEIANSLADSFGDLRNLVSSEQEHSNRQDYQELLETDSFPYYVLSEQTDASGIDGVAG
jgi:hypothetical protein